MRSPTKAHYARRKRFQEHQPDPQILRLCPQAKICYQSERVAKQYAAKALKRDGISLYSYRCPYCRWWHLTHLEQWA
jgi:hypothetical protein